MKKAVLSSTLTFIYKFVIPTILWLFSIFIITGGFTFLPKEHQELYYGFGGFMFVFSALITLPLIPIKKVSYDSQFLYYSNYKNQCKVPLKNSKEIRRWLFYFFKIDFTNNQGKSESIVFMPHISEMMNSMGIQTPKSIVQFKSKIE